ncbi:MAG TPA: FAD-binding oxidoreductase [Gemmatimonadaceae bacterium]|nr:FAD-binding oxidoreductase [Gemmatimonadaceae bacterium]
MTSPDLPSTTSSVWDDGHGPHFPALDADVRADLCVIGLGASGLSAVLEARALGASVIGLDATVTAGGAAGSNGGILRAGLAKFHHEAVAAYGRERAAALYRLTAAEIDRAVRDTPVAVRRTGNLRVAADPAEWADCAAQLAALRADGVAAEERDTPFGRGVFVPADAAVQPLARGRALARRAVEAGAVLHEWTRVGSFSGTEVRTPRACVRCGAVVVAVDGGLEHVLPALRGRVRTTRLQMLATEPDPAVQISSPMSSRFGYDYWQQLPDGRIALGGGRDRAMDREWDAPAVPSDEIQSYLEGVLRERIGSRAQVTHRWAARVAYSTSGLPVLAEVETGVWATGAYNGTGNLMGALCGRAAAQLACGMPSAFAAVLDGSASRPDAC